MSLFPMFIDLSGKRCIIVGGGSVAARKAGMLAKFGADITVVSPETTECIKYLRDKGLLDIREKTYMADDIQGAFLAIAATSDKHVNESVYEDAVKNNIFVNVVDYPEKCTFIFPSIIQRNDLVMGISTSGSYPALSKNIRKRIESIFPVNYGEFIELLKEYRKKAMVDISDAIKRKELLYRLLDEKLFDSGRFSLEEFRNKADKIYSQYLIG